MSSAKEAVHGHAKRHDATIDHTNGSNASVVATTTAVNAAANHRCAGGHALLGVLVRQDSIVVVDSSGQGASLTAAAAVGSRARSS